MSTELSAVCRLVKGGLDPRRYADHTFAHYSIPAFDSGGGPAIELGGNIHSQKTPIPSGVVLVSKLNPRIPRVWYVNDEQLYQRICSTEFVALQPDPTVLDPAYLSFALRDALQGGIIKGNTAAATKSRERAKPTDFLRLRVKVPSLSQQRRIVDLLSRAENIVRMRREAEKKAKEIIPALFLDMFGDPARNPKGWPVKPLAVLVRNLDSARKPVRAADRAQMAGRYPYYGASGIIDHVNGYTHEENALLVAEDGANLLSRSTPIAFQASGRYWVNNHAHVLGHAGVAELTFLECSLNLRDLREYITGSAQPKLTQAALLSIPIAVAPVAAQASFARRLSSMDVVVSDQQKAFGCAEQVFQSLLTGVFSEGVAS